MPFNYYWRWNVDEMIKCFHFQWLENKKMKNINFANEVFWFIFKLEKKEILNLKL